MSVTVSLEMFGGSNLTNSVPCIEPFLLLVLIDVCFVNGIVSFVCVVVGLGISALRALHLSP